jgi:hypothetical protein
MSGREASRLFGDLIIGKIDAHDLSERSFAVKPYEDARMLKAAR